jgi:hypothetical protein
LEQLLIHSSLSLFHSLHTSTKRLAELPPSDRPTIGASSIFDNLDKDIKAEEQVSDKVIPHEEREVIIQVQI